VGDDDQSIYGWRGADVEHILNFQSHFPGAKVVRLEHNYRCTDAILEAANRLVRHNRQRHEKTLIPHKQATSDVRFLEFADEVAEAEHIVREIGSLIAHKRARPSDVAILFRTNEQPRVFETELRRLRLRYRLVGGQSFFDRREVRDVLAYLKAIVYPEDEASLRRIINVPARGIGAASVEKVVERAVRERTSFWKAVPQVAESGELGTRALDALRAFQQLLAGYRRRLHEVPERMAETLKSLLEEIDYQAEIRKQYPEPQQQLARSAVLEQMVDALAEYTERTDDPTPEGFLADTALLGRDEEFADEPVEGDAITLMTLHSAKGLEFPRVYLVGLEEGLLPHHRSLEAGEAAIAEERRLAYVGITRAMDHLTISRAAGRMKWGKRRASLPSRFLFEMRGGEQLPERDSEEDALSR
jgi:DNA helicase-2/ATP-dependent DNA helicase PcrA